MMKIFVLSALLGASIVNAQNQPLDWGAVFQSHITKVPNGLFAFTDHPRNDLKPFDAQTASRSQIVGALEGTKYALTGDKLYQPTLMWSSCSLGQMSQNNIAPLILSAMKEIGYVLEAKKTLEAAQIAVWKPRNRAYPRVVTSANWKCDIGQENMGLVTFVAFQVGENRHDAYSMDSWNSKYLGIGTTIDTAPGVQIVSPKSAIALEGRSAFLVNVYNPTAGATNVSFKVVVRNKSGQIIDTFTQKSELIQPNSPRQDVITVLTIGAYDATVTIQPGK